MSLSACSASSAAVAGAPRACAARAASSRIDAISRLGSAVASARCRARSSADGTSFASRACSDRRRDGVWRAATADPSSGWVNRRRSPSSSRIRAASVSASPASERRPTADSTSGTVGSASAATARATSSAAGLRPSMRACRSSSRSDGIGSSSPGASVPPLRWSALASSSAKKGLPREVSQSLISVGRGNVASRRARSSSWSRAHAQAADLDRPQPSLGHGAAKPVRHIAADRQQGGDRLIVEAGERVAKRRKRRSVQPLDVVDREAERAVAGEQPQRSEERGRHGAVVGVDLRLAEQQRGLERPPLDRRQLGQDVAGGVAEEVGQPREREAGLGLRGPGGQDPVAAGGGSLDAGQPQRRLADPGLARQHDGARKLLGGRRGSRRSLRARLPCRRVAGP